MTLKTTAAALTLMVAAGALAAPPLYDITEFGALGGSSSRALAISNAGLVVGWAQTDIIRPGDAGKDLDFDGPGGGAEFQNLTIDGGPIVEVHAFLWDEGTMLDLGTLGGAFSEARAVNDWRQVVGTAENADEERHAFVWQNGRMFDLNELLRYPDPTEEGADACNALIVLTEAVSINDDGTIIACGYIDEAGDVLHGYVLTPLDMTPDETPSYTFADLGTLEGTDQCVPYALNDAGLAVGESGGRAFVWINGHIAPLEAAYPDPRISTSVARDINGIATSVGHVTLIDDTMQASMWRGGAREMLYHPMGAASSALDVNGLDFIVGWTRDFTVEEAPRYATMWYGCEATNLNQIVAFPEQANTWTYLEEATGIDDYRRIVGYGQKSDGTTHGYMLTLVNGPDWNKDALVDEADLQDFATAFFAGQADYNEDGKTDRFDFIGFLEDFFPECN